MSFISDEILQLLKNNKVITRDAVDAVLKEVAGLCGPSHKETAVLNALIDYKRAIEEAEQHFGTRLRTAREALDDCCHTQTRESSRTVSNGHGRHDEHKFKICLACGFENHYSNQWGDPKNLPW